MASVGSVNIAVNYVVNNNSMRSVNNSISRLQNQAPRIQTAFTSAFSKIGVAVAAAFSVKAITDFTKKATQLASELQEVQNVVDVVFGSMSAEMDAFAKNAMKNFGLGETAAKKYASTYAAMAQSFGFTNDEVIMLSKSMTQLVGDTASFRNVSHDIANTKLKAIFTGETEALKEWGIVMTQAALQEFAYSRGITTKIQKMTEQEKVILRYNFVMSKLNNDMGDFQRTQDGWANQTRMLSDKFSTVISTFGAGFITILTPAIQALNTFLDLLQKAADKFASFVALLYGKKATSANQEKAQAQIAAIGATATSSSENLEDLADGYDSVSESAKAAKESLASFDNVVQLADASGSASGSASGNSGLTLDQYNFEEAEIAKGETLIDKLITKLKEFKITFGGAFDFESLKPSIETFFNSFKNSIHQHLSSAYSIGESIVGAFAGGISKWLADGIPEITNSLNNIYLSFAGALDNISSITADMETVLTSFFNLESTQEAIANALSTIDTLIFGTTEYMHKLFEDTTGFIARLIEENTNGLVEFCANTSTELESITGTIETIVEDCFKAILENYDQYIKPTFDNISQGFSDCFGAILEFWNSSIAPFIDELAKSFDRLWNEHLGPFVEEVLGAVGVIAEFLSKLFSACLVPFVDNVVNEFLAPLMVIVHTLWGGVEAAIGSIVDCFTGLIKFIRGFIDIIMGLINEDWNRVMTGFKDITKGLLIASSAILDAFVNVFIGLLNGLIRGINSLDIDIPGTDIKIQIPEIQPLNSAEKFLSYLADGGIVYRETNFGNFVAGEAGAEAIVPLENSEYTKVLAREIVNGMVEAGMSGGNTYNIENAFGDDRAMERLVNKIEDTQKRMGARRGVIAYG